MTHLRVLLLLLLTSFQIGCTQIYIDKPIGETWTRKERMRLVGRWVTESGDVQEVQQTKEGVLVFAALNWDEKEQKFKAVGGEFTVTHLGDIDLLFFDAKKAAQSEQTSKEEREKVEGFVPCVIQVKDKSNVELIFLKTEALVRAIEASKLPGKVTKVEDGTEVTGEKYRIVLSSSEEKVTSFFKSPEFKECLDRDAVLRYSRITGKVNVQGQSP